MKKLIVLCSAISLLLCQVTASAKIYAYNVLYVAVFDNKIEIDYDVSAYDDMTDNTLYSKMERIKFTDAQPFLDENYRTQVPVRALSEMLGAKVEYNEETKTATVANLGTIVNITVGSDVMSIEEKKSGFTNEQDSPDIKNVYMDTVPVIKDSRMYVPVRSIAEALGYQVISGKGFGDEILGGGVVYDDFKNKATFWIEDENGNKTEIEK